MNQVCSRERSNEPPLCINNAHGSMLHQRRPNLIDLIIWMTGKKLLVHEILGADTHAHQSHRGKGVVGSTEHHHTLLVCLFQRVLSHWHSSGNHKCGCSSFNSDLLGLLEVTHDDNTSSFNIGTQGVR